MEQMIEIIRGTTNTFEITVTDGNGSAYALGSNEKIVFGIKRSPSDSALLIVKVAQSAGDGRFRVTVTPGDTDGLPFGRYYYDVGLDDGTNFYNIIPASQFFLRENITSRGCAN